MLSLSGVLSQVQRERDRIASGLERLDQAIRAIEGLGEGSRGRRSGRRISACGAGEASPRLSLEAQGPGRLFLRGDRCWLNSAIRLASRAY